MSLPLRRIRRGQEGSRLGRRHGDDRVVEACRRYLAPLIQGEDYPPYANGLPRYVRLKNTGVPKKLNTVFELRT